MGLDPHSDNTPPLPRLDSPGTHDVMAVEPGSACYTATYEYGHGGRAAAPICWLWRPGQGCKRAPDLPFSARLLMRRVWERITRVLVSSRIIM